MQKENYILKVLTKDCGVNNFTVIDKKDLLKELDKLALDETELDEIMTSLERKNKIKIKYDDENVYCVSVLKNDSEEKEGKLPSLLKIFFLVFLSSFLGSFVATIISIAFH